MAKRIEEKELLLPALYILYLNGKANTTGIIRTLVEVLNPQGKDAELNAGRKDTKFSQKVRNLMGSHYKSNGMSLYTTKDNSGYYSLTEDGKKLVETNILNLKYLFDNSFAYEEALSLSAVTFEGIHHRKKVYVYPEDYKVTEGKAGGTTIIIRERSQKLRNAAIEHYTTDGTIKCCVCGFDFKNTYGKLGEGYIQMHHEKPIYQYSTDGFEEYISQAVENMKPLCANCHCIIHRNKQKLLSVIELKAILDNQK